MSDAAAMEAVGDGSAKQPDQPAVDVLTAGNKNPSPGTSPHQRPPLVQIQRPSEQEEGSDTELVSPVESAEFVTSEEDFQDAVEDNQTAVAENGKTQKNRANGENAPKKEWVPPDDAVRDRIIKQVEFYFSDANITKDAFLLKHVKRNKEGYVSIKLLTSFKKVKSLTKEWRSVCYSLQQSDKLQVNAEGTKVKRRDPLPDPIDINDSCHSRTIVVANLPDNNPSIESINEQFKHCGEIALIRILRPGKPLPADVRKHMETHFEAQDKLCALVEFEQAQAATKAIKSMRGQEDNWRSGLHVSILHEGGKKEKKKKEQQTRKDQQQKNELSPGLRNFHGGEGTGTGSDGGASGDASDEKKKRRRRRKKKGRVDELTVDNDAVTGGTPSSSDYDVDSGTSPSPNRRVISRNVNIPTSRLSPSTTPKSSPCGSPHGSPRQQRKYRSPLASSQQGGRNSGRNSPSASPEMTRKYSGGGGDLSDGSGSNASSPWVQRRRLLAAQQKNLSPAGSPLPGRKSLDRGAMACPDGVSRLPRGPDDLGGFYAGKGRGKPRSTSM